jgi:hypothetical protein
MTKHNIFKHGISGRGKSSRYITIIRNLFFKKFYVNVFIILALLIILSVALLSIKRCPPPVECPKPECPECYCSPCPECECPEQDCSKCPPQTEIVEKEVQVLSYICPSGVIVNKTSDCKELPLPFAITSPHSEMVDNITFSLDLVEYEMKDDDWGTITRINFTVINQGSEPIMPKILVRIYGPDDSVYLKKLIHREIGFEKVLMPHKWVRKSEGLSLSFSGDEKVIELELQNTIPDPDKGIVKVSKEIIG